jgi:hypothetical protein
MFIYGSTPKKSIANAVFATGFWLMVAGYSLLATGDLLRGLCLLASGRCSLASSSMYH